jgi:hypothetical protein
MRRPNRLVLPGDPHHITHRGNYRQVGKWGQAKLKSDGPQFLLGADICLPARMVWLRATL